MLSVVHKIAYANNNTLPSLNNPTLPLSVEVDNTTNTTDIVVESASLSGFTEGIKEDLELLRGESAAKASIGTTETPVLSLHNHTVFQGKLNRVVANLLGGDVSVDGTKPAIIRIRLNPALTGASFSDHDTNNSVISVDTTASAVSGGKLIDAQAVGKDGSIQLDFGKLILHPQDTVTISIEATSGTTDTVTGVDWDEDF